jgi:hypothetical protein
MKTHVQIALVIAAMLYLAWGLSLLVAPEWANQMLSSSPLNTTTSALFGAGLFAFVIIFFIAAHRPGRETVHAAVTGLLFTGVVGAYQLFIAKTMPQTSFTVVSLAINVAVALYLLMALTESALSLEEGRKVSSASRRPKARKARRRR